jgi:hypothetical protein
MASHVCSRRHGSPALHSRCEHGRDGRSCNGAERPRASASGRAASHAVARGSEAVNRIRIEYGADPIYELPKAEPAWKPASTCVLQRAFADLGVAVVDYDRAYGKGITIEHGLADFIRDFDAGKYPELLERSA